MVVNKRAHGVDMLGARAEPTAGVTTFVQQYCGALWQSSAALLLPDYSAGCLAAAELPYMAHCLTSWAASCPSK